MVSAPANTPHHTTPGNRKTARRPFFAGKICCLWLTGWAWFLNTYNSSIQDFSIYDILFLFVFINAVLCAQTVFAFFANFCRVAAVPNALLALFAVINAFSLHIILVEGFINLPATVKFIAPVLGIAVAFVFFISLDDGGKIWNRTALAASAVLFAFPAGQSAFHHWKFFNLQRAEIKQTAPGETTSSPNIQAVRFLQKPNVYFISFDGLAPRTLVRRHFGTDKTVYQTALENQGFRILKNHFSRAPSTVLALNKFLAMDPDFYEKTEHKNFIFTGLAPSPLYEIFRANGYATYTNHFTPYFGFYQGKYVDHYVVPHRFAACLFLGEGHLFAFFTYCPMLSLLSREKILDNDLFKFGSVVHRDIDLQAVLNMYGGSLSKKESAVFLSYIFLPGHSFPVFHYLRPETHENFYRNFFSGGEKAAQAVEKIMNFIKQNDPGAVVYVFGDHGPWVSRGLKWNLTNPARQKFMIHDRYGVLGAIYPADTCRDYFSPSASPGYTTPDWAARQIVRCLAGGDDPFINPVKYPLDYNERGYGYPGGGDYADYLYE